MTSDSDIETNLLNFAAGFAGRLPPDDVANASDLICRREWGVGLEVLCAQLAEHEVELSANEKDQLKQVAAAVEVDISGFGLVG